jgi:uncharacterized protein YjbI with pentapeptide repeats
MHREEETKSNTAIRHAITTGAELVGAYLHGADLSDVSFEGRDLSHADFTGANVSRASFRGAKLRYAVFSKTTVREADFDGADLYLTQFDQTDLSVARFGKPRIKETKFLYSNLTGIDFYGVDVPGARFRGSNLTETTFCREDFSGAVFNGANLSKARFQRSDLSKASFNNCELREANFSSCDLSGSQLRNSLLTEADLRKAKLGGSVLTGVDLSSANLRDAVLIGAQLEEANLERADLRGTDLSNARLYQAILHDVRIDDFTTFGRTSPYSLDVASETEKRYGKNRHLAAAWVFQRIEGVYRENAMVSRAWEYHVLEKESLRRYHREMTLGKNTTEAGVRARHAFQWALTTVSYHLTRHGKSVARPLGYSVAFVVLFGVVYPFTGFTVGTATFLLSSPAELFTIEGAVTLLQALFFSFTMFVLGDFGDSEALGTLGMILAEFESVLGIVVIAITLFVYGLHITE